MKSKEFKIILVTVVATALGLCFSFANAQKKIQLTGTVAPPSGALVLPQPVPVYDSGWLHVDSFFRTGVRDLTVTGENGFVATNYPKDWILLGRAAVPSLGGEGVFKIDCAQHCGGYTDNRLLYNFGAIVYFPGPGRAVIRWPGQATYRGQISAEVSSGTGDLRLIIFAYEEEGN